MGDPDTMAVCHTCDEHLQGLVTSVPLAPRVVRFDSGAHGCCVCQGYRPAHTWKPAMLVAYVSAAVRERTRERGLWISRED